MDETIRTASPAYWAKSGSVAKHSFIWMFIPWFVGCITASSVWWVCSLAPVNSTGNGVNRTDKFTAEVIGVWWNDGNASANYFTLRFPNEEVKDIQVNTGLRFAGKKGDAVFGTVSNGKYTVEGIRRNPWVEIPANYVGVIKDNRSYAEKELERLRQMEAFFFKREKLRDEENIKKQEERMKKLVNNLL